MVFINGLNGTIVTSFIHNTQKLLFVYERLPLQEDCSNPVLAVVWKSFWTKPLDSSSSCLQPNLNLSLLSTSIFFFRPSKITFLIWRGTLTIWASPHPPSILAKQESDVWRDKPTSTEGVPWENGAGVWWDTLGTLCDPPVPLLRVLSCHYLHFSGPLTRVKFVQLLHLISGPEGAGQDRRNVSSSSCNDGETANSIWWPWVFITWFLDHFRIVS